MNRRDLLRRAAALGVIVATPEPLKRFWALDQTHLSDPIIFVRNSRIAWDDRVRWIDFAYINARTGEIVPYPSERGDAVGLITPDGFIMNATITMTLA